MRSNSRRSDQLNSHQARVKATTGCAGSRTTPSNQRSTDSSTEEAGGSGTVGAAPRPGASKRAVGLEREISHSPASMSWPMSSNSGVLR